MRQTIIDANNALARLATFHHWQITVVNGDDKRRHSCTITHGGRRVSALREDPCDAIRAAIAKLSEPRPPRGKKPDSAPPLRLVSA